MCLNIVAILLVVFAVVALLDSILALLPFAEPVQIVTLFSYLFYPVCFLFGIPVGELSVASGLMAQKLVLNELVSYQALAGLPEGALSAKSKVLMVYAMCGFANFGSLGILLGGLTTMMPVRKSEIVELSWKSVLAGTLATMYTACLIGLIV